MTSIVHNDIVKVTCGHVHVNSYSPMTPYCAIEYDSATDIITFMWCDSARSAMWNVIQKCEDKCRIISDGGRMAIEYDNGNVINMFPEERVGQPTLVSEFVNMVTGGYGFWVDESIFYLVSTATKIMSIMSKYDNTWIFDEYDVW